MFYFGKISYTFWIVFVIQYARYTDSQETSIRKDRNRDDEKFNRYPVIGGDLRKETDHIVRAHEVLRIALRDFLNWRNSSINKYLEEMRLQNESYYDESGVVIKSYRKVFSFILDQVEEVELGNYAVKQFEKDRHDLCSVARYLSHQVKYAERKTILERMGEALGRPCDPCTAYKRHQHAETVIPITDDHKCLYNNSDYTSTSEASTISSSTETLPITTILSVVTPEETTKGSTSTATSTHNPSHSSSNNGNELDLKPCSYRKKLGSSVEVNCENLSVIEVFGAFRRSPFKNKEIDKFTFNMKRPSSNSHHSVELPEDLIDDHKIQSIRLYCPEDDKSSTRISLRIDMNAFRYSQLYTTEIVMRGCDLGNLDLSFLTGFDQLKTLSIDRATDFHKSFVTLPPLKTLNRLSLRACADEDVSGKAWTKFPRELVHGITELCLSYHDDLDDSMISRILDWVLISSADTLREFDIFQNKKMTTIPSQVKEFKKLVYFSASYNGLPLSLPENSLHFGGPIENIHLTSSQIDEILPGTFKGDFSHTEMIDLSNNKLTRFEEAAFLPLLEQMSKNDGKLRLDRNPIDCETDPCHLAWLIRDRRELLDNVFNAKCSFNGTLFQNIDYKEDHFIHCPDT